VSVYDFNQSIVDGATVPLYYENRVPTLQLLNEDFNEDLERALAIYATGADVEGNQKPIADKSELVEKLRVAIAEITEFCEGLGINLMAAQTDDALKRFISTSTMLTTGKEKAFIPKISRRRSGYPEGETQLCTKLSHVQPVLFEVFSTRYLPEKSTG